MRTSARSFTTASAVLAVMGITVVGGGNPAVARTGAETRPVVASAGGHPFEVSCPSTTFCAATDDAGNAFTFDGTSWSSPAQVGLVLPTGLGCGRRTFCLATGYVGGFTVWDGRHWSTAQQGPIGLVAVSCPVRSECFALTNDGDLYGYSAEGSWSELNPPGDFTAAGLTCTARYFCLATDTNGTSRFFDGASWSTPVHIGKGSQRHVDSASCVDPRFCMAVFGRGSSFGYDGSDWRVTNRFDVHHSLFSVSCATSSFCTAIASRQARVTMFDGSSWSAPMRIPGGDGARSISCPTATFCMAVSWNGAALEWSNGSWTVTGFDT